MRTGRLAAGFKCPKCKCDLAYVESILLPQVELRCQACEYRWCVEP